MVSHCSLVMEAICGNGGKDAITKSHLEDTKYVNTVVFGHERYCKTRQERYLQEIMQYGHI